MKFAFFFRGDLKEKVFSPFKINLGVKKESEKNRNCYFLIFWFFLFTVSFVVWEKLFAYKEIYSKHLRHPHSSIANATWRVIANNPEKDFLRQKPYFKTKSLGKGLCGSYVIRFWWDMQNIYEFDDFKFFKNLAKKWKSAIQTGDNAFQETQIMNDPK